MQMPRRKYMDFKFKKVINHIGIKNEGSSTLGKYGGNTSVRLPTTTKPTLSFGQDEVIFRSSQLNDSCWTIDGQAPLRTKGLGVGVMVSGMTSREFG